MSFANPPAFQGPFSQDEPPEVRRRILAHLEEVHEEFQLACPGLEALVLVGSFARGEGTLFDEAPYNDYDLLAVVPEGSPTDTLVRASRELAPRLGFGHLDLEIVTRRFLGSVGPSMFFHDLKSSGKVLWGDPDVLSVLPPMEYGDIGVGEARILMFNRLTCPLEKVREEYFQIPPGDEEAFAVSFMASKIVLCAASALLILKGQYRTRIVDSVAAFRETYAGRVNEIGLVVQAGDRKLFGDRIAPGDVVEDWFRAREFYMGAFREVLESEQQRPVPDWLSFARSHPRWSLRESLRWYKKWFLDPEGFADLVWIRRRREIEAAEILLIESPRNRGAPSRELMSEARRLLRPHVGERSLDRWEDLRSACVWADHAYVHPIIEADTQ